MRECPSHSDSDRSRDAAPPTPAAEARPDKLAGVMATLERGVEGILDDAGFAAHLITESQNGAGVTDRQGVPDVTEWPEAGAAVRGGGMGANTGANGSLGAFQPVVPVASRARCPSGCGGVVALRSHSVITRSRSSARVSWTEKSRSPCGRGRPRSATTPRG